MSRFIVLASCAAFWACSSGPKAAEPASSAAAPVAASAHGPVQRVIAFAGAPVDTVVAPPNAVRGDPGLPAGLHLDPRTGRVTGTAAAASTGRLYGLDSTPFYVEIVAPPRAGDRFVAPGGNDAGDATQAHPFRTIAHAIDGAGPGTTIFLRGGSFREDVTLSDKHGGSGAPIVIRSYPGEHATIEGARIVPAWTRASDPGAAPDEWVSTQPLDHSDPENLANRGVMFGREPFTHLLNYSRLEDLRSPNQLWKFDSPLPGPDVIDGPKRPWAYFGPGIWMDPASGIVHLRLSPTTNHVQGLADYTGPTDPAKLDLGVWFRASTPLMIKGSSMIEIHDLDIVGGGERTVVIDHGQDIVLDHVVIDASTNGLVIGDSERVRFVHGRIDGGIPTWVFRSDFKDNYKFKAADGTTTENDLVRKTSRTLLLVEGGNKEIEIGYCELENGHDNYMAGIRSELHHCLIRNIHDDALFISHTEQIDDLRIHDNVIEKILTGLSGEGKRAMGPRYIYRNIFDLREPTASIRPGLKDETYRWGWVFKGDFSAGPTYFYQNTLLLGRPGEGSTLMFFRSLERDGVAVHPRWFVNNIIAVDDHVVDRALSWVPESGYLAAKQPDGTPVLRSDGNVWLRDGATKTPMFRCLSQSSARCATRDWASVDAVGRETGFEAHSRTATGPIFRRMQGLTSRGGDDDLRPGDHSPALGAGIELPALLPDSVPPLPQHDAGALTADAPPLRVGIDGRHAY